MKKNLLASAALIALGMSSLAANAGTFKITEIPDVDIRPANGETIVVDEWTALGRIEITVPGEDYTRGDATPYYTFGGEKKDFFKVEDEIDNFIPTDVYTYFSLSFVDINLSNGLTESGEYVVTLPEGFIKNKAGDLSEAMTLTYTVEGGQQSDELVSCTYTFTPMDPKCFNLWTLDITGVTSCLVAEPGTSITITNPDGEVCTTMYPGNNGGGGSYIIDFGDNPNIVAKLSVVGEYTITVPERMFLFNDNDDNKTYAPGNSIALTHVAEIEVAGATFAYTLNPDPEKKVNEIRDIEIHFDNATGVALTENAYATITTPDNRIIEGNLFVDEMGNGLVMFTEPLNVNGSYTFFVTEGSFSCTYADGTVIENGDINVTYTVDTTPAPSIEFVTDPAEGATVSEFSKFTITFPGNKVCISQTGCITLSCGDKAYNMWDDFSNFGTNVISFLIEDGVVITEGTCIVTIPENSITVDDANFAGATITFNVGNGQTAVEGIDAETLFTVYSLQGVRLLDGADAAAVKALAPGLYIINGKKTVIR